LGWQASIESSAFHMEFQMTIQTTVEHLSSKQASMLIKVLVIEAIQRGIDLTLYLSLEYLFNFLIRSYDYPEEIKLEKDRQAAMLANLILVHTRGEWLNLGEREMISERIKEDLLSTGWLPDKRTFMSWKQYWDPRKFLRVRIVPLESFLRKKEGFYVPYSSYTKGYGESGPRSRQSTPPSAELDGSDILEDLPPEIDLSVASIEKYQRIRLAIESEKVRKRQDK
jgi:hypothetical protein